MDIKQYIESGILEAYAIGAVTEKERREVECLSKIHEEIAEELLAISLAVESFALTSETTPPGSVKESILEEIKQSSPKLLSIKKDAEQGKTPKQNSAEDQTNRTNWLRIAAAIAILIACALGYTNFRNTNELSNIKQELASIQGSKSDLARKVDFLNNELSQTKTELAFLQDTATVSVPMKGIPEKAPTALATVFWNTRSNEAYVSIANLPAAPSDKQYQLWAIVDGKPTDMGVFEIEVGNHLQKVQSISGAQAFAVTLEQKGGSPTPTLEEMYVVGNV